MEEQFNKTLLSLGLTPYKMALILAKGTNQKPSSLQKCIERWRDGKGLSSFEKMNQILKPFGFALAIVPVKDCKSDGKHL